MQNINSYMIVAERWDEFLEKASEFGFSAGTRHGQHPDLLRSIGNHLTMRIPLTGSWKREIWVWTEDWCPITIGDTIGDNITDLFDAGYIKIGWDRQPKGCFMKKCRTCKFESTLDLSDYNFQPFNICFDCKYSYRVLTLERMTYKSLYERDVS